LEEKLLSLHLKENIQNDKYLKELKKKKTLDPEVLILQELLVPTVHSDLINVNYFLEVHFGHKGMTFGSKLKPAVLPIYIYAPIVPKNQL